MEYIDFITELDWEQTLLVITYLDWSDFLNLRLVCKAWRDIIEDDDEQWSARSIFIKYYNDVFPPIIINKDWDPSIHP